MKNTINTKYIGEPKFDELEVGDIVYTYYNGVFEITNKKIVIRTGLPDSDLITCVKICDSNYNPSKGKIAMKNFECNSNWIDKVSVEEIEAIKKTITENINSLINKLIS